MPVRPIIFGEALFDVFPDGHHVLGGAPFNVAWHLEGLEMRPRLVSRVGRDEFGIEILDRMRAWGLSTDEVQIDDRHPTGRVCVTIERGVPSFAIEADQAYDYIDAASDSGRASDPDRAALLYHGSLGVRNRTSRKSLERIGPPGGRVFCDLNLREPWWDQERIAWCAGRASWLKVSDAELGLIVNETAASREACLRGSRTLARRYKVANLIVTRGDRGAMGLFGADDVIWQDPVPIPHLVDTVGAGDAFSAMLIFGVLRGWGWPRMLAQAARFASDICGLRGATHADRTLYAPYLRDA